MPSQTLKHFLYDIREFTLNKRNPIYPDSLEKNLLENEDDINALNQIYEQKIEHWLSKCRKFTYAYALLTLFHLVKLILFDSIRDSELLEVLSLEKAYNFVISNYSYLGSIIDLFLIKLLVVIMSFTTCYQFYSKSDHHNLKRLSVIYSSACIDIFFFVLHITFFIWKEIGVYIMFGNQSILFLSNPTFNSLTYLSWVVAVLFYICFCHSQKELSLALMIRSELLIDKTTRKIDWYKDLDI
ncbi:hypothetical protein ABK040_005444 [Willaertia magna]